MQPKTPDQHPSPLSSPRPLIDRIAGRIRRMMMPLVSPPAETRIVITSVPKAGTHLLEKTVKLLPGFYSAELTIEQFRPPEVTSVADSANPNGPPKQARAQQVSLEDLAKTLDTIKPGHYAVGHLVFSKPLAALMADMGIKVLCILRDPRDIAVSFTKYVSHLEPHYLFNYYQTLSESERLLTTIVGTADVSAHVPRLLDISVQMKNMLPWTQQPNAYTAYFEKLVGAAGGGSRAEQLAEVQQIAGHIQARCSRTQLEQVADQIFGNTSTFRKGTIGDWRNHFTSEHKQAFKRVAGQMLIDLGYEEDFEW